MFKVLRLINNFSKEPHLRAIKATGIEPKKVIFNPKSVPHIYQDTFLNEKPADPYTKTSFVSSNGALCAFSGKNTERKSKNSRLVKDNITEKTIQWNSNNIAIDEGTYDLIERLAVDYINHRPKLFLVDGYLGWDPSSRLKVRSFVTRAYHALFLRNILVRPTPDQIQKDFSSGVDITLFNGGQLNVSKNTTGTQDDMISAINPSQQKISILGTQFAGQMKKSLLKLSSYILPRKGQLTLRASAYTTSNNNTTLMIGLPGSGKGSLALHAKKQNLIANDQVVWTKNGIYNLEGGVYARILNLRNKVEDEIYHTIKFGALVENANHMNENRDINFHDVSVTQNARLCYPIDHLKSFKNPATSGHPNNVILLTCDLQGVLPPVAKLTRQQAVFFYLNGYTAMLNNKEIQPKAQFSTCYGGGCSPLHPQVYAQLLNDRLAGSKANIWLVNTGWTNGRYGIGKRIASEDSIRIVDAISSGELDKVGTYNFNHFNLAVPDSVKGVNEKLMKPETSWANKQDYDEVLKKLAGQFVDNYKKFHGKLNVNIEKAVPQV